MTKRGELPVDVMGSGTVGAFIRCPMHIAARFEWIRGAGSRPVWSASHADCAQGVTAIAAFCRGSHGRRYRAKTIQSKSSDLRGYAAEESEGRCADRLRLASVH